MTQIQGLHHISLISSHAQRTLDFYTGVLGLRLVKQTVNFDDPSSYHLYLGDNGGTPGSLLTFFEWPSAPRGLTGIGGTHHVALQVADLENMLRWKRRLTDLGVRVDGPFDRQYFQSIYFRDPDGMILEIATVGPGMAVDEMAEALGRLYVAPPIALVCANRDEEAIAAQTWPDPVPEITPAMTLQRGMHHISAISSNIEQTHTFYTEVLGMSRVKMTSNYDDPASAHWYWGSPDARPGSLLTYFERDPQRTRTARIGAGQTHHFALTVPDDATQLEFRERLLETGHRVSQVQERSYFRSIYTKDPDGHIVELATAGPGFTVDEPLETLGHSLQLPPWLEGHRPALERRLTPLRLRDWANLESAR